MSTYNQSIANLKSANWNNLRAVKTNNINRGQWESDWYTRHGALVARFSQKAANFIYEKDQLDEQKGKISAHMDYMDYKHGITNPKAVATEQAKADHTTATLKLAERFNLDVAETAFQARKEGLDPSFIELYRNANPHEKAELVKLWLNDNLSAEKYKAFLSDEFLNNTENLTLIDSSTGLPSHINWNFNNPQNVQLKVASLSIAREKFLQQVGLGNVDREYVKQAGGYKLLTDTETDLAAVWTKEFDIKDSLERQLVARRNLANELKKRSDDPYRNIASAYWNLFHAYKGGVNEKGQAYDYKMLHEAMDKEIENLAAAVDLELQQLDEIRTAMVPGSDDKKSPTYDKKLSYNEKGELVGYTPEEKWPVKWGATGTYAQLVTDENVKKYDREKKIRKGNLDRSITHIQNEFKKADRPPTEADLDNAEQTLKDLADGESIERWTKWREGFIIKPKVSEDEEKFWRAWVNGGKVLTGHEDKISETFKGTEFYKRQIASEAKWFNQDLYKEWEEALETEYRTMLGEEYISSSGVKLRDFTGDNLTGWKILKARYIEAKRSGEARTFKQAQEIAGEFLKKNDTKEYNPDNAFNGIFSTVHTKGGTQMPLLHKAYEEEFAVPTTFDQKLNFKTINRENGGDWEKNLALNKFSIPKKDYSTSLYNTGRIDQDVTNLSEASGISPFKVMSILQNYWGLGELNPEVIPEEENIVGTYLPKRLQKIIYKGDATPSDKKEAYQYIYKAVGDQVLPFSMEDELAAQDIQAFYESQSIMKDGPMPTSDAILTTGYLKGVAEQIGVEPDQAFYDFKLGSVEELDAWFKELTPNLTEQLHTYGPNGFPEVIKWHLSNCDSDCTPTESYVNDDEYEPITNHKAALENFYPYPISPVDNTPEQMELGTQPEMSISDE